MNDIRQQAEDLYNASFRQAHHTDKDRLHYTGVLIMALAAAYDAGVAAAAAELGKKGGASKSRAKRAASAANGKKGGRPRKAA